MRMGRKLQLRSYDQCLKKGKRPKLSGLKGGRVLNVLDLNNVMVNNGLTGGCCFGVTRETGVMCFGD